MAFTTFTITDSSVGVSADVTLREYYDPVSGLLGVLVTVALDTLQYGDLAGIFFDLANNDTSGLSILSGQTLSDGTVLNAAQGSALSSTGDTINNIRGVSIQGYSNNGGFDAGIAVNSTVNLSAGTSTATFLIAGASLEDLIGEEFAVRLKANNTSGNQTARLTGVVAEPATIGNFVFEDLDADGIQDAGETGISGVAVNLIDTVNNTIVSTTTTDASGWYEFSVGAGNYVVEFVAPTGSGYIFSPANQGSNDASDSDANPLTGRTNVISVDPESTSNTNESVDAGFYRLATLEGTAFLDADQDGFQDASESGIAGITVELLSGTTVVTSTTTASDGSYSFTSLRPGDYTVRFTAPTDRPFTIANAGTDDTRDSDVIQVSSGTTVTGTTAPITVVSGEVKTDVDAGFVGPPQPVLAVLDMAFDLDNSSTSLFLEEFDIDGDGDWVDENGNIEYGAFLAPDAGETFVERITIQNESAFRAENFTITLREGLNGLGKDSNIFVELMGATGDRVTNVVKTVDASTGQTILLVTLSYMDPNEIITINALSEVVDAGGQLKVFDFTFNTTSSGDPNDIFGNSSIALRNYVDASGLKTESGSTLFKFEAFDNSITEIDVDKDGIADADNELKVLRQFGSLTEADGTKHKFWTETIEGDVDARTTSSTSTLRSLGYKVEYQALWAKPPGTDYSTFSAADSDVDPNAAFAEFIKLTTENLIFDKSFSVPKLTINGVTYFSYFKVTPLNPDGTVPTNPDGSPDTTNTFTQNLNSGNILGDSNGNGGGSPPPPNPNFPTEIEVVLFSNRLGVTFDAFVKSLDPTKTYQIVVAEDVTSVTWFDYPSFGGNPLAEIISIVPLSGSFVVSNTAGAENLDLSQVLILSDAANSEFGVGGIRFVVGSNTVGDRIEGTIGNDFIQGGNGRDWVNGSAGNDTLTGGRSSDTFVFENAIYEKAPSTSALELDFGDDVITDFNSNRSSGDILVISNQYLDRVVRLSNFDANGDRVINSRDISLGASIQITNGSLILDLASFGGGSIRLQGVSTIDTASVRIS